MSSRSSSATRPDRGPDSNSSNSIYVADLRRPIDLLFLGRSYVITYSECLARFREAGLTYRQVDNWIRLGYLRPVDSAPGSGYKREWPVNELRVATSMAYLVKAGLTLSVAHEVAREGKRQLGPGILLDLDETILS